MEPNTFTEMFITNWLPLILLLVIYMFYTRQTKNSEGDVNATVNELKQINATLKEISQKLDK